MRGRGRGTFLFVVDGFKDGGVFGGFWGVEEGGAVLEGGVGSGVGVALGEAVGFGGDGWGGWGGAGGGGIFFGFGLTGDLFEESVTKLVFDDGVGDKGIDSGREEVLFEEFLDGGTLGRVLGQHVTDKVTELLGVGGGNGGVGAT